MVNKSEPGNHNVRILIDSFKTIGKKTHSVDHNASCLVLSQEIVNKNTIKSHLLDPTSKVVNLNFKTLHKYCIIREHPDTINKKDYWAFIGRLPHLDMKLINVVKGLVHSSLHDNTRISSNQKDVLKMRRGV